MTNTVYACRPEYLGWGPWKPISWLGSNNDVFEDMGSDTIPRPRPDLDEVLDALPAGVPVGINFERFTANGSGYKFLDWFEHRNEAEFIYESLVNRLTTRRPDLDFMLYTMPAGEIGWVTKDDAYPAAIAEREVALAKITTGLSHATISAYWNYHDSHSGWDTWRRRMDYRIALASTIHNKPIRAFVWDSGGGWKKPMPYDKLRMVLKYLEARDIEVVYWSKEYDVNWTTRLALGQYALGVL